MRKKSCGWEGTEPGMVAYHDTEWGVPVHDDRKHFEFLILESAQAGLSWRVVFNKRAGYRKAFANFDPKKVAKFGSAEIRAMLKNPGVVRNKLKLASAINNARLFLEIQNEFGSFTKYIWSFVGGKPKRGRLKSLKELPATSPESDALSIDLKKRGFKFVGSTVMYAHMQATGLVNDHLVSCFCYSPKK